MNRVAVKPELLRWARDRSRRTSESLLKKFPKLDLWLEKEAFPTLKQLESFAAATYVPIGYLFLPEPPEEAIPIPDLRTIRNHTIEEPSPDLLDTIYICQRRQDWYRDYARSTGEEAREFIGSAKLGSDAERIARGMRVALGFTVEDQQACPTWTDALREFIGRADDLGVLVMCSGVVLNNNNRPLSPIEFRGFAMSDDLAPLVFINGADTKAAQMFTLAHELAHLWLGESALTDVHPASTPTHNVEVWCNRVAAEFLVPLRILRAELRNGDALAQVPHLARRFKVSTLVILRRILDARRLSRQAFDEAYEAELARLRAMPKTSGGNFYLTQAARLSRRFARAMVASTLEGNTLYRDAARLLGFSNEGTFQKLGHSLGYPD